MAWSFGGSLWRGGKGSSISAPEALVVAITTSLGSGLEAGIMSVRVRVFG